MSVECIQPWLAHRPRRGATVVDTIVMHATGKDDLLETIAALKEKGLSYHYIIDRAGLPHKCVPYSAVAFHAGNSYGPHEAARGTSREQDANRNFVDMTSVNEYTIGLCLVNTNDGMDAYSQEQVDACIWLIKELKASVPALKYLTTHYWVSPGRVKDPLGLDVERIAKKAGLDLWMS
jgi:N-acetyl-anhydromuramyl-L-alanine amidase AmpD